MPISNFQSEIPVLLLFNLDLNWTEPEQAGVLDTISQLNQALVSVGYQTTPVQVTGGNLDYFLSGYNPLEFIVFNWCESLPGVNRSEWLVTGYLEKHGFTFTGSGSATLTLAQDKRRIKQVLQDSGIPTPKWQVYDFNSPVKWNNFPAIVKTSREHCSEGIDRHSVVTTETELKNRVRYMVEKYQQAALVEDFIDGRELHVSVWGNSQVEMLPPVEMEFSLLKDEHDRVCTYESKFDPESEQYQKIQTVLPAPLTGAELSALEQVCKAAYLTAGCRDYARIDLRMKDNTFYVIDVNPNSDISPDTSTISAAEFAGHSYGEFGGHIIRLAALRHSVWGSGR